jgi:polysaccharide pyruvyl transferase WcaK-like protein
VIRDRPSLEVLKELGISGEIAGDPVLTLSAPSPIMFGEALAVNLRPWPGELLPGAVRALREYLDRRGWPAVGIAMAAEDQELLSGLRDRGELPLRRVYRVRSGREFYEALGGCAGLAAMRLHALILGSVAGVSLLALPYDPKVAGFAESRGLPAGVEAIPSWNPGRLSDPGAREAASASVRGAFAEARRRWEEEGT